MQTTLLLLGEATMLYTPMSRRSALYLMSATAASAFLGCSDSSSQQAQPTSALTTANRPRFHVAPTSGWINDPQRPLWLNNQWNLWTLYNADYAKGSGTAWLHFTSTDRVNWTNQGVSIPKNTTSYGDIWTGSTIIDTNNTAGYGAGALIALMTMPCDTAAGAQNQSTALWYSTDSGKSFSFGAIVQPNYPGGNATFRDPSVFWHAATGRWVMSLAEQNKLSVYTSPDLKTWTYASGLVRSNLGTLECPNLFPLHLYDTSGNILSEKWVLLCGANGFETGLTTGTHYWVGSFDGTTFTPDTTDGLWLDAGADFYACTVFTPSGSGDSLASVNAIAWMNNWDYATLIPTTNYFGQLSVTRQLSLQSINGVSRLINAPLAALSSVFTKQINGTDQLINDQTGYSFPDWGNTTACRMDFTLSPSNGAWPGALFFSMRGNSNYFTQLTFDFGKSNIFFKRDTSGPQPSSDSAWTNNQNAAYTYTTTPVRVTVLIDVNSIEVFINDGQIALSSLITAPLDATSLNMSVAGGSVQVSDFVISPVA
ncbi:MAG: glycoside hydrolase family 32 protein [Acidobacteriaceae bacterium]|nr:glycoside hydrolase family 32 protein [Acidobacteriaceae bacterium]